MRPHSSPTSTRASLADRVRRGLRARPPGLRRGRGNPPWDEINVDELTFYSCIARATRHAGLALESALAAKPKAERLKVVRRSSLDAIAERERAALRPISVPRPATREPPGNQTSTSSSVRGTASFFRDGRLGVVLPRTAFQNQGSSGFRTGCSDDAPPRRIDFLLNKAPLGV